MRDKLFGKKLWLLTWYQGKVVCSNLLGEGEISVPLFSIRVRVLFFLHGLKLLESSCCYYDN